MELVVNIMLGIIIAATPLVFAAIGELVVEKAGVLNLGLEGMMIVGAIAGFSVTIDSGNYLAGIAAALVTGALMALLFGILTQSLLANQVATGLALTIFGLGVAALWGRIIPGKAAGNFPKLDLPVLSDLPLVGKLIFGQDYLVYLSVLLVVGVSWFFRKTRGGLILRAIGENHDAAHAIGYPVVFYRYLALLFGGACAGLGGAYLSVVQTPFWVEGMTAGRGWIALALVVFAAWRPGRALFGAYLFGGITILQLHSQGFGVSVEPSILRCCPIWRPSRCWL